MNENVLDDFTQEQSKAQRRSLIPLWMRIFIWIFLVAGIFTFLGFIAGLLGFKFYLSIYGLRADEQTTIFGVFVLLLFLLKTAVAYGLWFEQDWAITLGLIDAGLGIAICLVSTVYTLQGLSFTFRLELLALVPYFIKLYRMRAGWKAASKESS